MRFVTVAAASAVAAVAALTASLAFTEDDAAMKEGMKRWQEACTPGANHKKLERFIGTWDAETTILGMGGPPMKSKGTAEGRWLVEGRWVVQEGKGEMMGMPVHSFATMGYDNFKQKFVGSYLDSVSTTMLTSQGGLDQSGDTLITYGLMDEPLNGEHDKTVKYVWRFTGKDKIVFEIHDLAIGETNTKVVEVVYTRRK